MATKLPETDDELGRDIRALVSLSPGEDVSIRMIPDQGFEVRTGHGQQRTHLDTLNKTVSEALRKKLGGKYAH